MCVYVRGQVRQNSRIGAKETQNEGCLGRERENTGRREGEGKSGARVGVISHARTCAHACARNLSISQCV